MEKIYGLIGKKLTHSHSPKIHSLFGCEGYKLYELLPEELEKFLLDERLGGVNVTIPYKIEAVKYCEHLSDQAKEIGCVNTIVKESGKLYGYNTDFYGFCDMVKRADIDFSDKKVLVLGSGGASKTVIYCSKQLGAKEIVVISRSGENNYENISNHYDADIIVNTTPVGMYPENDATPIVLDEFKNLSGVLDLIYNPLSTRLIMQAQKLGIACAGGIDMLVSQAKYAYELFFKCKISDEELSRVTKKITCDCQNIVLIGMPGCGKSTIGKLLAEMTKREVFDTDAMICEYANKSIPEIFEEDGEEYFRTLETKAVKEAGAHTGSIIITGGGVVTKDENYPRLHQNGRIYHIKRNIDLLARDGRPLSKSADALHEMEIKRAPLYKAFSDAFVNNETEPCDAAKEIWRDFCENSCN